MTAIDRIIKKRDKMNAVKKRRRRNTIRRNTIISYKRIKRFFAVVYLWCVVFYYHIWNKPPQKEEIIQCLAKGIKRNL